MVMSFWLTFFWPTLYIGHLSDGLTHICLPRAWRFCHFLFRCVVYKGYYYYYNTTDTVYFNCYWHCFSRISLDNCFN